MIGELQCITDAVQAYLQDCSVTGGGGRRFGRRSQGWIRGTLLGCSRDQLKGRF